MHLHLPHFCLYFVLEKIRISMYFYVLRTHILFSFDHFFFFTVTGMILYCSMYLSISSKWGQKNESLFLRQKWMRQVFYFYIFCRTCNTTIYFFIYLNFNTQAIVPYVNFIERCEKFHTNFTSHKFHMNFMWILHEALCEIHVSSFHVRHSWLWYWVNPSF